MSEATPTPVEVIEPTENALGDDFTPAVEGVSAGDVNSQAQITQPAASVDSINTGEFDPESVNWASVQPEEVPERFRYLIPQGRKLMSMVNKTNVELRSQLDNLKQAEEHYLTRIENLAQGQGQAQSQNPAQPQPVIQQFGFEPGGDGYDDAMMVEKIAHGVMTPMQTRLDTISDTLIHLNNQMQTQTNAQASQIKERTAQEIDAAVEVHGDDVYNHSDDIMVLKNKTNPSTGQQYSVKEAYERIRELTGNSPSNASVNGQHPTIDPSLRAAEQSQGAPQLGGGSMSDQPLTYELALERLKKTTGFS